jgi:NAD(P)-dependent dehydrogenase (short-subunit alcohol dehydrogenase family)
MTYNLEGKVVLVTGATSGIGAAIAVLYAEHGGSVMLCGRNETRGNEITQRILASGGKAQFFKADVSDPKQCQNLVNQTVASFGRLDIASNNAGMGGVLSTTADYPLEVWQEVINTNLNSVFYCLKYELEAFQKQQSPGVIINMTSVTGQVGLPYSSAYSASKHGIIGLTKTAALEYAQLGVRINAVGPAWVETPILDVIPSEIKETLKSSQPMGRMGTVEEVAELVVWLSTSKASFITGAFYPIDGGYLAQ